MCVEIKSEQIVKTLKVTVNCITSQNLVSPPKYYKINNKYLGASTRMAFAVKFCSVDLDGHKVLRNLMRTWNLYSRKIQNSQIDGPNKETRVFLAHRIIIFCFFYPNPYILLKFNSHTLVTSVIGSRANCGISTGHDRRVTERPTDTLNVVYIIPEVAVAEAMDEVCLPPHW